ncbi:MAG: TetR family transcriptional regulator [Sandaracinus sp.]
MAKHGEVPSFNALAKEAGVGVGTVYRHFESAAALAGALAEAPLDAFRRVVEDAASDPDPARAIARLLEESVSMVLHQPLVARALLDAPETARAIEKRLEEVVARARATGVIRSDLAVDDFRRLVCGIELAARAGASPRVAAERYTSIVVAGLRPPAAERRRALRRAAKA